MYSPARAALDDVAECGSEHSIPAVFCWTKMGSEAGQPLADIVRRKELERQAGGGVFAWGIGNSVGPAIKHAKLAERIAELDTLFTPMKTAAKVVDASPTSVVLWRGYQADDGRLQPLPEHMLVTSRGQSGTGQDKRGHYALICRSRRSLLAQAGEIAIDHRAVCNLVSANPVGASQVTSVVRYRRSESHEATYPVLFRAKLFDAAFVRLALPVVLTGEVWDRYCAVCAARTADEWRTRLRLLKAFIPAPNVPQPLLF